MADVDVLTAAADRLSAALRTIDGVRHYRQRWGAIEPPATVLALATVAWNGMSNDPTDATWSLGLVVARSERSEEQLYALLAAVADVIDGLDSTVAFHTASADSYPSGGVELPALVIPLDVGLTRFA